MNEANQLTKDAALEEAKKMYPGSDDLPEDVFDEFLREYNIELVDKSDSPEDEPEDKPEDEPEDEPKDEPPKEKEFDPFALLDADSEDDAPTRETIRKTLDFITKFDPGDERHPSHKPLADTRRALDEKSAELRRIQAELDVLSQDRKRVDFAGFNEVREKDENGRESVYYVDDRNDPRIRKYGGLTQEDAYDNQQIGEYTEALMDYRDRVATFKQEAERRLQSEREMAERKANEERAWEAEKASYIKEFGDFGATPEMIAELEASSVKNQVSLPEYHLIDKVVRNDEAGVKSLLELASRAAAKKMPISRYIEELEGAVEVKDLKKPKPFSDSPPVKQDGSSTLDDKVNWDTITGTTPEDIMAMTHDELEEFRLLQERGIREGRITVPPGSQGYGNGGIRMKR